MSYAAVRSKGSAAYQGCQNHVASRPKAKMISPKPTAVSIPLELPKMMAAPITGKITIASARKIFL
jgi:hypothetical protein